MSEAVSVCEKWLTLIQGWLQVCQTTFDLIAFPPSWILTWHRFSRGVCRVTWPWPRTCGDVCGVCDVPPPTHDELSCRASGVLGCLRSISFSIYASMCVSSSLCLVSAEKLLANLASTSSSALQHYVMLLRATVFVLIIKPYFSASFSSNSLRLTSPPVLSLNGSG